MNIAVIGAGISALSCATALQNAGHVVQVFDKSRGVGGRMSTRKGDGWQADHGAPHFEARNSAFRAEAMRWCAAGAAARWQPCLKLHNDGVWQDGAIDGDKFVGTPAMTSPARLLASTLNVTPGTTINKLTRRADDQFQWHLQSAEAGWLDAHFDAVVIAIPAPQAMLLLDDIGHPFAAHTKARAASMHPCWALMMQFAEPLALEWDAAVIHDGVLSWAARDSAKPGRPSGETWVLHASAAWSAENLERLATEVAEAMIDAFCSIGGRRPQSSVAHRWRYAGSNATGAAAWPPLWDATACLGLCGDWVYGGGVAGAWLSGHALANELLGYWTKGG